MIYWNHLISYNNKNHHRKTNWIWAKTQTHTHIQETNYFNQDLGSFRTTTLLGQRRWTTTTKINGRAESERCVWSRLQRDTRGSVVSLRLSAALTRDDRRDQWTKTYEKWMSLASYYTHTRQVVEEKLVTSMDGGVAKRTGPQRKYLKDWSGFALSVPLWGEVGAPISPLSHAENLRQLITLLWRSTVQQRRLFWW